jgi:hypothetical protein
LTGLVGFFQRRGIENSYQSSIRKEMMPMHFEKLGTWLCPTLLSPWLSMMACVTTCVAVAFFFGQLDPKFGPFETWAIGMLAGSITAGLISLTLIGVDLSRAKLGTLPPVGICAWASGGLAFAITLGLYVLFLPMVDNGFLFGEALDFCMMVIGSIATGSISARLVFFRRTKCG